MAFAKFYLSKKIHKLSRRWSFKNEKLVQFAGFDLMPQKQFLYYLIHEQKIQPHI